MEFSATPSTNWDVVVKDLGSIPGRLKVTCNDATNKIGDMLKKTFEKRFDSQGPGWAELQPSTLRSKRGSLILTETGELRRSIEYQQDSPYGGFVGILRSRPGKGGGLGKGSETAANVAACHEFGTSKMVARPFIAPTFEERKDKIKALYAEAVKRAFT